MPAREQATDPRTRPRGPPGPPADERAIALARPPASGSSTCPTFAHARVVLGYAAAPRSSTPQPATRALASVGRRIAFPRIAGPGALTLHACVAGHRDARETGPFGITQPCGDAPVVSQRTRSTS